MAAVLHWAGDDEEPAQAPSPALKRHLRSGELPPAVAAALWRGDALGSPITRTVSSGAQALDDELPGGGWPCHALTEILTPQPSVLEWRLLGPALRQVVSAGGSVVLVGPPKSPHLPGLRHAGLDEHHLVWIQAGAPSERLWCTEQLVKANACGALVAWLPQARPEQIRRLQVCAQACDGPTFLFRPIAAQHEASAAPLRVQVSFGLDWALQVHVLKRRGPAREGSVSLPSIPGGLASVLTPRLRHPSRLFASCEVPDVVGRPAAAPRPRAHVPVR